MRTVQTYEDIQRDLSEGREPSTLTEAMQRLERKLSRTGFDDEMKQFIRDRERSRFLTFYS